MSKIKRIQTRFFILRNKNNPLFIYGFFKRESDAYYYLHNIYDLETIENGIRSPNYCSKSDLEVVPDTMLTYKNNTHELNI